MNLPIHNMRQKEPAKMKIVHNCIHIFSAEYVAAHPKLLKAYFAACIIKNLLIFSGVVLVTLVGSSLFTIWHYG